MKRLMLMLIVICSLMFSCSSCVITDEQQIRTLAQTNIELSNRLDDYQLASADLRKLMVEDKILSEKTATKIDKIDEEIDRVQPHLVAIAEAVRDADYTAGDVAGNLVKGGTAVVTVAKPLIPAPYGDIALLILGSIEVITAAFLKKKSGENETTLAKRQAEKEGREKTVKELATMMSPGNVITAADVDNLLYKNIGEKRAEKGIV